MTALADMLSCRDHERLLEPLDELAEIDRKMREPSALAASRDERAAISLQKAEGVPGSACSTASLNTSIVCACATAVHAASLASGDVVDTFVWPSF